MRFSYLPYRTNVSGLTPTADKVGDGQPIINIPDRRMWICVNGEIVEITDVQQAIDCWITVIDMHKERVRREKAEYETMPTMKRIKSFIRNSMRRWMQR